MSNTGSKKDKPKKLPGKPPYQGQKTRSWTPPTILGLVLTLVGALGVIELRPQLNVAPGEPLAVNQPFSAPFEVINTGNLGVHIENMTVIEHRIEQPGITITDGSVNDKAWDNFDLDRSGSKTVVVYFTNAMPTKAEMVIAVDYRFLWHTWRWFFRFEGIHMDNWRWSKQPIGDIEPAMNKAVDDSLVKHRELMQRHP